MHYDHILVTTDFSEDSYSAFDAAAYQAKMEGSKVSLLTIVEDWEVPEAILKQIPNPESISSYRKEVRQKAEEHLQAISAKYFHDQKIEIVAIASSSGAAREVCNYAKENDCDLIVMGTHGRGTLGNVLMGSVTQKVLQHSPCPVLVIPKKKRENSNTTGHS